jgi:DNA-binding MarR family transcriptional regulator
MDVVQERDTDSSPLDRIAGWYEASVPIRVGAIALAPLTHGVSAIADQGIVATFAFLRRARIRAFRNELTLLNIEPTEEEVRSREFMEGFIAAAARAENTTREEKIKLFARLFRSYWHEGIFTPEMFDQYEEELAIIDELSYREFILLLILDRWEQQHPLQSGMNRLQRAGTFWAEFEKEVAGTLGVDGVEVEAHLQRLSRTGLYQPITGAYLDYTGGLGYISPRFARLKTRLDPNSIGKL